MLDRNNIVQYHKRTIVHRDEDGTWGFLLLLVSWPPPEASVFLKADVVHIPYVITMIAVGERLNLLAKVSPGFQHEQ